jgi:hypothetical protein
VTLTLLEAGEAGERPKGGPTGSTLESFEHRTVACLPAVSAFVADTWVFFAVPHTDWTVAHWGLGFGPVGTEFPQWSLFRCVTEDRFDSRTLCPCSFPSNRDLVRWSTTVVGPAIATLLVDAVGSCLDFYRRFFAERPDLRGHFG